MFQCQNCDSTSAPRDKEHRFVVEKRVRAFGGGLETAREISVCAPCLRKRTKENDDATLN